MLRGGIFGGAVAAVSGGRFVAGWAAGDEVLVVAHGGGVGVFVVGRTRFGM